MDGDMSLSMIGSFGMVYLLFGESIFISSGFVCEFVAGYYSSSLEFSIY